MRHLGNVIRYQKFGYNEMSVLLLSQICNVFYYEPLINFYVCKTDDQCCDVSGVRKDYVASIYCVTVLGYK